VMPLNRDAVMRVHTTVNRRSEAAAKPPKTDWRFEDVRKISANALR
jgi:hypothetical protein